MESYILASVELIFLTLVSVATKQTLLQVRCCLYTARRFTSRTDLNNRQNQTNKKVFKYNFKNHSVNNYFFPQKFSARNIQLNIQLNDQITSLRKHTQKNIGSSVHWRK